jgi:NitT/TauT family transport system permease protein
VSPETGTAVVTAASLADREARERSARAVRERIGHNAARLLVLVAFIGLWHAVASQRDVTLLPGPAATYDGLTRGWRLIGPAALDTSVEIALGFAIGVVAGVVLGSLIGLSPVLEGVLHPFLVLYQAVPKTGLAPMIVLLMGFGILPKVALAAMSSVFPVLENTILGVQRVDEDGLRLFRALGARPLQTYFKLRLLSALPSIMTSLRAAVVLATVSVVVAEFVAGRIGLGAVMMTGYAQLDTPLVFGALMVLTLIGLAGYFAVFVLETLVLRWLNLTPPGS